MADVAGTTLSAADTFTDYITVVNSDFGLTITGTFVGTLTLQVAAAWRDVPPVWIDDQEYTEPCMALSYPMKETCLVRIGFKAGNYTSGVAVCTLMGGEPNNKRYLVTRAAASA